MRSAGVAPGVTYAAVARAAGAAAGVEPAPPAAVPAVAVTATQAPAEAPMPLPAKDGQPAAAEDGAEAPAQVSMAAACIACLARPQNPKKFEVQQLSSGSGGPCRRADTRITAIMPYAYCTRGVQQRCMPRQHAKSKVLYDPVCASPLVHGD